MSENREQKKTDDWFAPRNLFIVAAAAWGTYGSYIGFQKDTTVAAATMATQIKQLTRDSERNEADIRELRRQISDQAERQR